MRGTGIKRHTKPIEAIASAQKFSRLLTGMNEHLMMFNISNVNKISPRNDGEEGDPRIMRKIEWVISGHWIVYDKADLPRFTSRQFAAHMATIAKAVNLRC
jgi:hypothetical protein